MSSAAAQASSTAAVPYFLAKKRTPGMRRTPTSPCWRWMASQSAPMCDPARPARHSSWEVRSGVRLGWSSSFNAIPTALLAHVFAQQLAGFRIEQTNIQLIPLQAQHAPDPAWRCAVVGGLDLDATIQMHDALTVLV